MLVSQVHFVVSKQAKKPKTKQALGCSGPTWFTTSHWCFRSNQLQVSRRCFVVQAEEASGVFDRFTRKTKVTAAFSPIYAANVKRGTCQIATCQPEYILLLLHFNAAPCSKGLLPASRHYSPPLSYPHSSAVRYVQLR